jgi:hypothetical protein
MKSVTESYWWYLCHKEVNCCNWLCNLRIDVTISYPGSKMVSLNVHLCLFFWSISEWGNQETAPFGLLNLRKKYSYVLTSNVFLQNGCPRVDLIDH